MSDHKPVNSLPVNRRDFLRRALTTGVGVAAVAVAAPTAFSKMTDDEAESTTKPNKGYRLTQHIAQYYKTAAL